MTIPEARQHLISALSACYDSREAVNITDWVIEHLTGLTKAERLINKHVALTDEKERLLHQYIRELENHRPVQYVLQEAWFYGRKYIVDERVLIPRPETEELTEWIINDFKNTDRSNKRFIDIGTGSGIIAISLFLALGITATAVDISPGALALATRNAKNLQADIRTLLMDFRDRKSWKTLGVYDCIVSNPPYIPQKEAASMAANVLQHEPHIALFVENEDPLLFYRLIAEFAQTHLLHDGRIYVEISENLGDECSRVFKDYGFIPELRKDLQGRDRMIRAVRSVN